MKLNKKQTAIFLTIYAIVALFVRFYIEPQLNVTYAQSISIGLVTLVPVWLLFKYKFITLRAKEEEQ